MIIVVVVKIVRVMIKSIKRTKILMQIYRNLSSISSSNPVLFQEGLSVVVLGLGATSAISPLQPPA